MSQNIRGIKKVLECSGRVPGLFAWWAVSAAQVYEFDLADGALEKAGAEALEFFD